MMEKQLTIRMLLGFTQSELALLLGVPRSVIAKFETGKGNLPVTAKYLLADMLAHAESEQSVTETTQRSEALLPHRQKIIEQMLLDNQVFIVKTTRQHQSLEKKYKMSLQILQQIAFLNERAEKNGEKPHAMLKIRESNAKKSLQPSSLKQLIQLNMQLELLQLEKLLLESQLRKIKRTLGVTESK